MKYERILLGNVLLYLVKAAEAHLIYSVKHIVIISSSSEGQGYSGLIYRVCSVQFISQGVFALKHALNCDVFPIKVAKKAVEKLKRGKKYKMSSHKHC